MTSLTKFTHRVLYEIRIFRYPLGRYFYKIFFNFLYSLFSRNQKISISKTVESSVQFTDLNLYGASIINKRKEPREIQKQLDEVCSASLILFERLQKSQSFGENQVKSFLHQYPLIDIPGSNEKQVIFDFILSDYLTKLVAGYLGVKPFLTRLDLLVTPSSAQKESTSNEGSQLFHTDHEDSHCVKIFLPLKDINKTDGPTEFISANYTDDMFKLDGNKSRYRDSGKWIKHSDQGFDNIPTTSFLGKKGDILLVDTCRCLHRGSRGSKNGRIMLYAQFCTPTSFSPIPLNLLGMSKKAIYPLMEYSKKYNSFYRSK